MVFPAEWEDLRGKEEMFSEVIAGWSIIDILTAL